ncbi:MAG: DUF2635 domain-containing protein [Chitinispirillales bacterium]|nr:DUF2635 domain-containing protein [Chitinispirillales bacterium]
MKRMLLTAAALAWGLCALPNRTAAVPVQDMSVFSLAAEYYGTLNGHFALYDFDSSALSAHFLRLHYSPTPWLRLSGGLGGSRAYASPSIYGAEMGLSMTGGVGFYTPKFFRFLSLTAGYDCLYLTAAERSEIYRSHAIPRINQATGATTFDTVVYVGEAKRGATTAVLHAPSAGIILRLSRFADCEIGGVYHYFNIKNKDRAVTVTDYDDEGAAVTAPDYKTTGTGGELTDQTRLYAAVTLHERNSGAYVAGGASYALTNAVENDNTILPNFSVWGQIGLIMRDPREKPRDGFWHRRRGGAYEELKAREERMAEALNYGSERGERRRHGRGPRRGSNGTPPRAVTEAVNKDAAVTKANDEDVAATESGGEEADAATTEE